MQTIKLKMKSLRWSLIQYHYALIKRVNFDTETHTCTQEKCHMNMKAEIRVMCLQAKKQQKLTANQRGIEQVSPTALRRNQTWQHLDFRLLTSQTVRQHISVFKPPSPPYFIIAAQANSYINLQSSHSGSTDLNPNNYKCSFCYFAQPFQESVFSNVAPN